MNEIDPNIQEQEIERMRSAALQTSTSILTLQQRAEQELLAAKKALEDRTEELANSLSLLRATLESTAAGIVAIDLTGKIISYNTKFAAMWGLPSQLLEQRDMAAVMEYAAGQVKEPGMFLQRMAELRAHPEAEAFNIVELTDGRTFERYGFPQWVEQECVGIVVNWRDVTAHKQAEAALRRSEEKYRLLWAIAEDAFVLFDSDNTILEANAAVATIFGYQPEEVIGQKLSMLQPERLREGHRQGIKRYLATGARTLNWRAAQALGLHRDGHEVPLEIAFNHLLQDGENLFAGFIRDISDRKQAEAEREVLLAREQAARAEAEIANRAKDEFLATLSHELRTPLTAILGWSLLLTDKRLSEEERIRAAETIKRNANLQAQLIEDVLDVSRIISGKLRLEVRALELPSVIEAAIQSVLPAAGAKEIRLQRVLDSGPALISGDPNRLQQVMWNLLSNAIKFTPKGGRVQVRLERVNSHVEIIVTDTGEGIKPEALPYIFDRFHQADSTATRNYGGLGLGLAIVRHLVEMHGGTVEAQSDGEGQGATFIVKLPLLAMRLDKTSVVQERAEAEERVHPTANSNDHLECPPELDGLHVLLVDDDEDARTLIGTVLEKCAARVTAVTSAAEALAALQELRPDVLISDLGMPGEDGYSLISKVRSLPPERGGETPAAALTAYARVEDRMRVLRSGFQIHIPKPVEPAELVAVVANLARRFSS